MKRFQCIGLILFACLAGGCGPKAADKVVAPSALEPAMTDVVVLKDGSRLVGRVTRLAGGKLTMTTEYVGEISLEMDKVASITTDTRLHIKTEDEAPLLGVFKHDEARGQHAVGDSGLIRDVDVSALDSAWLPEAESPAAEAARLEMEKKQPKLTLRAQAGINGKTGNSERVATNVRIDLTRSTETTRWINYIRALYARENGADTDREYIGFSRLERDFSDRWFTYGQVFVENDKIEDIELRLLMTAGLGWFAFREEHHELKFRGGAGYLHETAYSGSHKDDIVAELGWNYKYVLTDWLLITQNTTYIPNACDSSDYRVIAESAGEIPLSKDKVWKFRAGMRNQYDAQPGKGVDRMETTYFANIVVDLW